MLVVGVVHGAREAQVAEAIAGILGVEAVTAVAAPDVPASPLVLARHRGEEIDPGRLAADLRGRGDVIASLAGGLLAPLTPRYAIRDLARDLGWPIILAVPANGDAVNLARLSLASARGAGLAVGAIVLTGWPEPPDRVMIDERKLLGEIASCEVAALGRGGPDGRWDPVAWFDAVAPAPAPGALEGAPPAARVEVALDPYTEWPARETGDPRATPRPRIMEAMLEIIAAEGPMRATRAYALYNKASGGKKLTTIARAPLSSAVHWLAQERKIVLVKRDEIPWQDDDIVRTPDSPEIRVRELGPRILEEVPLDEIAELMRRLRAAQGIAGDAAMKRAVLQTYGLVRLTARADEYLGLALDLLASD